MGRADSGYWDDFLRRRVSRRRLFSATGLVTVGLTAGACATAAGPGTAAPATSVPTVPSASAPPASAASPTAVVVQAKRGGAYRWASTSSWPHLDPHLTNNSSVFGYVIGVCYSRLLKFKLKDVALPAFIPIADAAISWEQPDDLTYVFKLRPGMKWQNIPPVNGRPLVADDIIYSYNRQRTKGYPNADILTGILKLEAPDPSTLKITVDKPSADFLINLASSQSPIVSREAVELKGDLKEGPMVGTGPLIVEQANPQGTSAARRNPDYYVPGQPYIDRYEHTFVADYALAKAAFRAGNGETLQAASTSLEEADMYKREDPNVIIQMIKGLGSGTELGMKADRPPFNDLRVRRAIWKAFDPETVIKVASGSGWLSVGLPLPGVEWALPQDEIGRLYKRDLPGAMQLLKEAGLDGGLSFTLSVFNASTFPQSAEFIVAQWREANIRATIRLLDSATYSEQVRNRGEFEAYIGSAPTYSSADAALFSRFHSKGAANVYGVKDDTLDQMIERQTTLGRNPDERKKLLLDIQRRIIDQQYLHFFHTFEAPSVQKGYVRDYYPGFGGLNLEVDKYAIVWMDK